MNWNELKEAIEKMTPEQRLTPVTVGSFNPIFGEQGFGVADGNKLSNVKDFDDSVIVTDKPTSSLYIEIKTMDNPGEDEE